MGQINQPLNSRARVLIQSSQPLKENCGKKFYRASLTFHECCKNATIFAREIYEVCAFDNWKTENMLELKILKEIR
jgi:hypothetical protein